MPVRVVLIDDHEMVIEGLKAMLTPFGERVEVIGTAVRAESAMPVIAALPPTSCCAMCGCRASADWICAGRSASVTPGRR